MLKPIATTRCRISFTLVLLLGAWSCGGGKSATGPSQTVSNVTAFVSSAVALDGQVNAVSHTGAAPAPAGGPTAVVSTSATASGGYTNLLSIQASAPFQSVILSVTPVTSASRVGVDAPTAWFLRPALFLETVVSAQQASDYLQIDLPAPVTDASIAVSYPTSFPASSFDLRVQVASPSGGAGPIATVHKVENPTPPVEMVGIVFGRLIINPSNPTGPGLIVDPVAGATVSTSLDSRTTTTNGGGAFDLVTGTSSFVGVCFTLTISASGHPTYSTPGWRGNKNTGPVTFILSPAFPVAPGSCS